MRVDPDQIAGLLTTARQAHQQYRAAQPRRVGGRVVGGDPGQAAMALHRALDAREEADQLDPEHTAPMWYDEPQHDELLRFYRATLSRRR